MSENADKPHEPTQRKLQKAREQGEVARSAELNTLGLYIGGILSLTVFAPQVAERIIDTGGAFLSASDRLSMASAGAVALLEIGALSGSLIVVPAVAVSLCIALQRSAVFAPSRFAPKLSRISPISGIVNKFGPAGLFEFAKSSTKMLVYTLILSVLLWRSVEDIITSAALPAIQGVTFLAKMSIIALSIVTGVAAVIAAIDIAWQRYRHAQKNRMSHQEMKDEFKDSDGDPNMKAKRRQKAQEIATNQMMLEVPKATVVIVNPTHYAVALQWSPNAPTPPLCVAKGVDHVAARIREAAGKACVPVFSDPPTARALHATVDLGDPIAKEHFRAVAAAIRFAEALRDGKVG